MSANIWTQCGGISNLRKLKARPWRVVEAQHIVSTLKLVDSLEEHRILEDLIDRQKRPAPKVARGARLHWLLFTPFRYPPLRYGSRFGTREEPGIWYGAEALRTVFSEKAYYRFVFLAGTAASLTPITVEQTAFRAEVESNRAVDLIASPFDAHREVISSKTEYQASQLLGREMRKDGVHFFRYTSARDSEGGANVGILSVEAFAKSKPHSEQTWLCYVDPDRVQFTQKNVLGPKRLTLSFARREFEVDGAIPAPAL